MPTATRPPTDRLLTSAALEPDPGTRATYLRAVREAGLPALQVIAIVSIALVSHGMLAGVGVLASRQARNELACRTAALEILNRPAPVAEPGRGRRWRA